MPNPKGFKFTTTRNADDIAKQWQEFQHGSFRPYRVGIMDNNYPLCEIGARHRTDLTDLVRVCIQDLPTEADVETLWVMVQRNRKNYFKLKVNYHTPVKVEFAIIFEAEKHLEFLRLLAKTGKIIVSLFPAADTFHRLPFEIEQNYLAEMLKLYDLQRSILEGLGVA